MTLKIGIIGSGRMGERHAHAYEKIRNTELIGFADAITKKSESLAKQFHKKSFSVMELLENNNIDAIHVCSSNAFHYENTMQALKSGKHVLVEKPMALSLNECDDMISESKKSGMNLMVGHTYRFYPSSLKVQQLLDTGNLGQIKLVTSYSLDPGFLQGKGKTPNWALSKEMGGGVFFDAIHAIDLFRSWFHSEISEVYVPIMDKIYDEFTAEQMGLATLRFENGIVGTIMPVSPTWGIRDNSTIIIGKKGVISVTYGEEVKLGQKEWEEFDFQYRSRPVNHEHNLQGFINEISEFVKSIEENRSPLVTMEDGRKNLQVVLSMYESYHKKKIVNIDNSK